MERLKKLLEFTVEQLRWLIPVDRREIMGWKLKPNNELFETYSNISNRRTLKQTRLEIESNITIIFNLQILSLPA